MALMYVPFYLLLLGICSTLLWLPGLGLGIFLLKREKRCRQTLGVLFGLWGLSMVFLLGSILAETKLGIQLRNWLYTALVYVWGIVSILLLIAIAWYAVKRFSRKWARCFVKVGCALSVFAVLTVGFCYLALTTRMEEVGTWQGEQVVMRWSAWSDGIYSYYRYNGPFLLGDSLGWSESPWELREWG